jgi:TPR repeat protein
MSADFQKGWEAIERKDYATALQEFKPLAEQGVAEAQYNLGVIYDNGYSVAQNDKEAVKWYRLAAEQGFAKAQYNLGRMYARGEGIPEDDKEAVKWYRLAAEQGFVKAQYNLGRMYARGEGIRKDNVYAYMWFNLAAAQDHLISSSKKNEVFKEMTPMQFEKAQRLSLECIKKDYKNC